MPLPPLQDQGGGGPGRLRYAPGGGTAPLRQGGPGAAGPVGGGRRPGAIERSSAGPDGDGTDENPGGGSGQGGGARRPARTGPPLSAGAQKPAPAPGQRPGLAAPPAAPGRNPPLRHHLSPQAGEK